MEHQSIIIDDNDDDDYFEKEFENQLDQQQWRENNEDITSTSSPPTIENENITMVAAISSRQSNRETGQSSHVNIDPTFNENFLRMSRGLSERRRRNNGEDYWSLLSAVSIFRLPPNFREISVHMGKKEPEIVSIGPYHRGEEHLHEFEEHKWYFLNKFLARSNRATLHDHMLRMDDIEAETRKCYSEDVLMSSVDFTEMMLLDGCFLTEVLCHLGRDDTNNNDPIFSRPWLIPILVRDVLKLENQLPLFILNSLYSKSSSKIDSKPDETFIKCILEFFNLSWSGPTITYKPELSNCKHLLDLFYTSLLPSLSVVNYTIKQDTYRPSTHSMQCVTQLRQSGIKFRPRKSENFLDIEYKNRVLHIPPITINDIFGVVLINCVALEQCQDRRIKYFSDYVSLMHCLISQPRDVAFLYDDRIIANFSQNDQYVAGLFNDLGKKIDFCIRDSYLSKQFSDVEAYYSSNWAYMTRTYFSSPWSFISIFTAVLLLILSFVQAFMSVFSYLEKR